MSRYKDAPRRAASSGNAANPEGRPGRQQQDGQDGRCRGRLTFGGTACTTSASPGRASSWRTTSRTSARSGDVVRIEETRPAVEDTSAGSSARVLEHQRSDGVAA